jgi:hypothetical protein
MNKATHILTHINGAKYRVFHDHAHNIASYKAVDFDEWLYPISIHSLIPIKAEEKFEEEETFDYKQAAKFISDGLEVQKKQGFDLIWMPVFDRFESYFRLDMFATYRRKPVEACD